MHFKPVAWPVEPGGNPLNCQNDCGEWKPYTRFDNGVGDPRTQDSSNGGTSPQNYVNIASSCIDTGLPSIYYNLRQGATPDEDVLMFRWRVEQIANTYGTGPNAGSFGSTDPWNSALWTVLIDVDGDGFRDLAAHLDGSSGSPSASIDRIAGIWGNIPTQSVDYLNDPNIHLIAHNPTGFTDGSTLLNFQNSLTPTTAWTKPLSDELWDYGTSRSTKIVAAPCNEYFVDYQIPIKLLDASALGGPKLDRDTPLSMLFCTANSLNNPFQKDCALNKEWTAEGDDPGPFGDFCTFNGGCFNHPIIDGIEASGCGIVDLAATAKDALAVVDGQVVPSVQAVDFYYYHDENANGIADDSGIWLLAAIGSNDSNNGWSATWDATSLLQGQYLIGVQALDDPAMVDDGMPVADYANRTFSYLTQVQVDALGNNPDLSGEIWWANPQVTGVKTVELALNSCGVPPPWVEKTVNVDAVSVGDPVEYTITVHNTLNRSITLSEISDILPPGFTYDVDLAGGNVTPSTSPTNGATGTVSWTFTPSISLAAGADASLVFRAISATVTGTYSNTAGAVSSEGDLLSEPVEVVVGEPRLAIAKDADTYSVVEDDSITFTITYSNPSPVDANNVVISDVLPAGLTFVSATNGGTYSAGTINWNLGTLTSGAGPFVVSYTATVNNPYDGSIPLVNVAVIDSDDTAPVQDDVTVFVDVPRPNLVLQKSADKALVDPAAIAPGNQVVFTLDYSNAGSSTATGLVLSDPIPTGFTYVTASPAPASAPAPGGTGTVVWNLPDLSAGASGSVTLTLEVDNPYGGSNPMINTATIVADGLPPQDASAELGVLQPLLSCSTYYFSDVTANVGFDGVQKTAIEVAPVAAGNSVVVTAPGGANNYVPAISFYQDPANTTSLSFNGDITTEFHIDRVNGAGIDIRATVYDYDSVTGGRVQLGQNVTTFNGSAKGLLTYTVTVNGTLLKNHRLLWVYELSSVNAQTSDIQFQYGGTVTNNYSGGTVNADSNAAFCVTTPATLVMEKSVDKATASATDTLVYTIRYANTGQSAANNVVLTDTLPAGTTFVSATVNAVPTAPNSQIGQLLTFNLGNLAGGATGEVAITATVDSPISAGTTEFLNLAALNSDETPEITDDAVTTVTGTPVSLPPELVISKSVDISYANSGDVVTYTLNVLNVGGSTANNLVVSDTIPAQSYFSYVTSSISGGDSNNDGGLPGLSWNINSLAAGANVVLGFQMQVGPGSAPAGTTSLDNYASVVSDETPSTDSNVVTVSIDSSPNLELVKSVNPTGDVAPGDTLTYTLQLTNSGDSDALDVRLVDPFPAWTYYQLASATTDKGTVTFDAPGERLVFDVGTLASGATATLGFSVTLRSPMPDGSTTIINTATASASNTRSVEDSVSNNALAAVELFIDKTGPESVSWPSAELIADAAGVVTIYVEDASQLATGRMIHLQGQYRKILAINGQAVTLDSVVTAATGDTLQQAIRYGIAYGNSGDANATSVLLEDILPANVGYVSASPVPDSAPAQGSSGTVSWSLGTLAAGENGNASVTALPLATGLATNTARITSAETPTVEDDVPTQIGGLKVHKYTTTPVVWQTPTGTSAEYVVQISNQTAVDSGPFSLDDLLVSGFTYSSVQSITLDGNPVAAVSAPTAGDEQPGWGLPNIPAGSVLEIRFTVGIAPTVGPATYQNEVLAFADVGVMQFDFLATTVEDVTVLVGETGVVEGIVYSDNNQDGIYNEGDTPLAGVDVIINGSDPYTYIATTDANGYFRRVVGAGTTILDVDDNDLPPGVSLTTDLYGEGSDSSTVVVPSGGSASDNTGYIAGGALGSISGTVYHDLDSNQVMDAGEPVIPGVTVELYQALTKSVSGAPLATTLTQADGSYSFINLPPGAYQVVEIDPAGYTSTTANILNVTVQANVNTVVNFGDLLPAAIGNIIGTVYLDENSNLLLDGGETGLVSVTVELRTLAGALISSTVTLADGSYSFPGLPVGDYRVLEIDPTGYTSTTSNSFDVSVLADTDTVVNFGDLLAGVGPEVTPAPIPALDNHSLFLLVMLLAMLAFVYRYRQGSKKQY